MCLLGFIVVVAMATIVATHRIVGPLMRIRRIVQAVADGRLHGHLHALRERDELKETFESVSRMVQRQLRERQEEDVWSSAARSPGRRPAGSRPRRSPSCGRSRRGCATGWTTGMPAARLPRPWATAAAVSSRRG